MSLEIDLQDKPTKTDLRTLKKPSDVNDLQEINEIRNKVQEVFLMIGLDRGNHIRKICVKGIGTSTGVYLDSKELVKTALINSLAYSQYFFSTLFACCFHITEYIK